MYVKVLPVSHAHASEAAARRRKEHRERRQTVPASRVWVCVCVCTCMLLTLTFVDVECDGADCDADHAFRVVEKLNGLGVQGKVISVLFVGDREGAPVSKVRHCTAALRWSVTTERREQPRETEMMAGVALSYKQKRAK